LSSAPHWYDFIIFVRPRKDKDFFVASHRDASSIFLRDSHTFFSLAFLYESICILPIAAKNAATRALHTSRPAMQVFASKPLNAKEASVSKLGVTFFVVHVDPEKLIRVRTTTTKTS
jgi:hypothetical protein